MFNKIPKKQRSLRNFQVQLRDVKTWNNLIIKEIVEDITKTESREYYEDLLTAILVSNAEILATIAVIKNPAKINLKIPKLENYFHECIINVARALYKNAFLFDENVSSLQRQRHNNEFTVLVRDAIQYSLHQILPIQDIIKQYITGPIHSSADDDLFLPDDELPAAIEQPPIDPTLQAFIKHGNDEYDEDDKEHVVGPTEPEQGIDDHTVSSKEDEVGPSLDESNKDEVEPCFDESDKDKMERCLDESLEEMADEPVTELDADIEPEVEDIIDPKLETTSEPDPEQLVDDTPGSETDFVKMGNKYSGGTGDGKGFFVEENGDEDNNHEEQKNDETEDTMAEQVEPSEEPEDKSQTANKTPSKIRHEQKLSEMMLQGLGDIPTKKYDSTAPASRQETEDDDLSLYGLSDGNTNWSDDDDNEFAYTDDEFLSSNGDGEDNDEDIDTMINRIRSAAKDSEVKEIKIDPQTEDDGILAGEKKVHNRKPDDLVHLDASDDETDSRGRGEGPNSTVYPPSDDIKMIDIEATKTPRRKSRKSRKSKKKSPIVLFPDAASADECV